MQRRNKPLFFLTIAVVFTMAIPSNLMYGQSGAHPTGLVHVKKPVPNQYIVVLKDLEPRPNAAAIAATARSLSAQYSGELGYIYTSALHGFAVQMQEAEALALSKDPRVDYVHEDAMIIAHSTQFSAPWGLDRIDQRTGLNGAYNYARTGAGVHVYLVDSGIQANNPDFGGRVASIADFVNDGQNGNDCNGHGTFVAGILGGATYGVAKEVTIHSLRVLDCAGQTDVNRALAAVDWINANRILPAVVNMSFGVFPPQPYPAFDDAVRNSIASGITYVVSAGNDAVDASTASPADVAEAITVAATDSTDVRWAKSNFGPLVDLFAPGASIVSDFLGSTTQTNSETSFAAPHVTGAAALYLQLNPGASPATVRNAIVAASTKNVVGDPGAGSPNALLFVYFPPATVTIAGAEQHACTIQEEPTCRGLVFDSGWVSATVNGHTYTASYGHFSTPSSIASALAASMSADPTVTVSSSGPVISLVSRTFSCYTLSTDYNTSQPIVFNPSFSATATAPNCP